MLWLKFISYIFSISYSSFNRHCFFCCSSEILHLLVFSGSGGCDRRTKRLSGQAWRKVLHPGPGFPPCYRRVSITQRSDSGSFAGTEVCLPRLPSPMCMADPCAVDFLPEFFIFLFSGLLCPLPSFTIKIQNGFAVLLGR